MDAKTRPLLIIALLGLVLVPYLLGSRDRGKKPAPPNAAAPTSAQAEAPVPVQSNLEARAATQEKAKVETDDFVAQVTNLNGGLTSFVLKGKRYDNTHGKAVDIVTTDRPRYLPLAVEIDRMESRRRARQLEHEAALADHRVALARDGRLAGQPQDRGGTGAVPALADHTRRQPRPEPAQGAATGRDAPLRQARARGQQGTALARSIVGDQQGRVPARRRPRQQRPQSAGHAAREGGPISFTGVENVYFLSAIAPDDDSAERCRIEAVDLPNSDQPDGSLFGARLLHRPVSLEPGASKTYRTLAYLGPKSPGELGAAGHSLKRTIESGWFSSLAEGLTWLLRKIHDTVGNWGLAIILLTLLVKSVLFPLTAQARCSRWVA